MGPPALVVIAGAVSPAGRFMSGGPHRHTERSTPAPPTDRRTPAWWRSWDPDLVGAARQFIGTLILDLFCTPVMALPAAAVIVTARYAARVYRSVVVGRLAGVCVAVIATIVLSARPEDWPDGDHVLRFATFHLTTPSRLPTSCSHLSRRRAHVTAAAGSRSQGERRRERRDRTGGGSARDEGERARLSDLGASGASPWRGALTATVMTPAGAVQPVDAAWRVRWTGAPARRRHERRPRGLLILVSWDRGRDS